MPGLEMKDLPHLLRLPVVDPDLEAARLSAGEPQGPAARLFPELKLPPAGSETARWAK